MYSLYVIFVWGFDDTTVCLIALQPHFINQNLCGIL